MNTETIPTKLSITFVLPETARCYICKDGSINEGLWMLEADKSTLTFFEKLIPVARDIISRTEIELAG